MVTCRHGCHVSRKIRIIREVCRVMRARIFGNTERLLSFAGAHAAVSSHAIVHCFVSATGPPAYHVSVQNGPWSSWVTTYLVSPSWWS